MSLDQITPYGPALAVALGLVLLAWSQRDRLKAVVSSVRPATKDEAEMSPEKRFATLYALRTWCEKAGHAEAVKAIDAQVLPTIVRRAGEDSGGNLP